jgi:hypothetical protein
MRRSGIDESLNLLKDLEVKLKANQKDRTDLPRAKAENIQGEVRTNKKEWGEKLVTAYESENDTLLKENRKLKQYVNMLLKMNDYLKNQLVRKEESQAVPRQQAHRDTDSEVLKMEIEYLREIGRQKELELQLHQRKSRRHERIETQLSQPLYDEIETNVRRSSKYLPERKIAKSTMRKYSEADDTIRKSVKRRKPSKCRLCCC